MPLLSSVQTVRLFLCCIGQAGFLSLSRGRDLGGLMSLLLLLTSCDRQRTALNLAVSTLAALCAQVRLHTLEHS